MSKTSEDLSELIQRAGRADGWKDFNGMFNPAVASVLRTGTLYLPQLRVAAISQSKEKLLMPVIIGRLLRQSNKLKVQNWFVAKSPHAHEDKLEYLFSSSNDPEIIEAGSASEDHHIRCAVAANPNTPVPVLNGLALDSNKSVRLTVVDNPRTPLGDLEFLMHDYDLTVRRRAREKLSVVMGESWVLAKFGSS